MAEAPALTEAIPDCDVYYSGQHASDSWTGRLRDVETLSEYQVREYIRTNNAQLFSSLRSMPLGSSDISAIPQQENCENGLVPYSGHTIERGYCSEAITSSNCACPTCRGHESSVDEPTNIPRENTLPPEPFASLLKRYVNNHLRDGSSIHLRQLTQFELSVCCWRPACPVNNIILPGSYCVTIASRHEPRHGPAAAFTPTPMHFCLPCLEDVFDGPSCKHLEQASSSCDPRQLIISNLDGVSRMQVLEAAAKLYNIDSPANMSNSGSPANPALEQDSSEAAQSFRDRRQTMDDIDFTLAEVARFERARAKAMSRDQVQNRKRSASPDLKISRPYFCERMQDRYKKQRIQDTYPDSITVSSRSTSSASKSQGQGQVHTENSHRHVSDEDQNQSNLAPFRTPSGTPSIENERLFANSLTERVCYCREIDEGDQDMVRCAHPWCAIGWFHLECAEICSIPKSHEKPYFCRFCQPNLPSRIVGHSASPSNGCRVTDSSGDGDDEGNNSLEDDASELSVNILGHLCESDVDDGADEELNELWDARTVQQHRAIETHYNSEADVDADVAPQPGVSAKSIATYDQHRKNRYTTPEGVIISESTLATPMQAVSIRSQPWGTPINIRSLTPSIAPASLCPRDRDANLVTDPGSPTPVRARSLHRPTSPTTTPPSTQSLLDGSLDVPKGITHGHPSLPLRSVQSQEMNPPVGPSHSSIVNDETKALNTNATPSIENHLTITTFRDLAPYMFALNLSPREMDVFENWKAACQKQQDDRESAKNKAKKPHGDFSQHMADSDGDADGEWRLSKLLAQSRVN